MSWCRLEPGYFRHPKTLRLIALLKDSDADKYLPRIWAWAAGSLESGTLPEPLARRDFEAAALWDGPRGQLFDALVSVGYVDVTVGIATLHDWHVYNGYQQRESRRLRERKVPKPKGARVQGRVDVHAARTDGRTYRRTNGHDTTTAPPAEPAKQAPLELVRTLPAHVALVEAFAEVYRAKEGKPYRHQRADFAQAAPLAAQGVTPGEVKAAAERAWRPGISPWLQVRNFKQLASRFAEVAVAKSSQAQHNVATTEELELQEKRLGEVPL